MGGVGNAEEALANVTPESNWLMGRRPEIGLMIAYAMIFSG